MRIFCWLGGPNLTQDDFAVIFSEVGKVSRVTVPRDPATGKTRGFAFVEMPREGDGERAIASLHGARVGKRVLTVKEAHGRAPREAQEGSGSARPGVPAAARL